MVEHEDIVKKYRQRRAARLGYQTVRRYDSVEEYRRRRAARLKEEQQANSSDKALSTEG